MIEDTFKCDADEVIGAIDKYVTQEQRKIFNEATGQDLYRWVDTISNAVVFKAIEFSQWLSNTYGFNKSTYDIVDSLGDDFSKLFREVLTSRPMFAIAIIN